MKKLTLFFVLCLFVYSCSNTSPTNVKKNDTQKVTSIEYGTIKNSLPVKIKGESDWKGATAGALIGGLLGAHICGEGEIAGTKCQDIGIVFGTIGGAAAGTVIQATLGNHNGFQYIINIDSCGESSLQCESNQDKAFVQGDKDPIPKGQKVVIIYGEDVRIMPYEQ
tara:strand:+ start:1066 stop:1563 length:498 start_codon:yes stop_codon:yes gene_type:complete